MAQHRAKRRVRLIVVRGLISLVVVVALCGWQWNPATAWLNDRDAATNAREYVRAAERLPSAEREAARAAAVEYNEWLADGGAASLGTGLDAFGGVDTSTAEFAQYASLLTVGGTSIMGNLMVKSIDAQLTVVHGTTHESLNSSAGHLYGTSLPVGGPSTHAVIGAHSGWSTATLFNNLGKVAEGDTFTLTVMGETLTYQVDQIQVALPDEASEYLRIQDGHDYVTLTTCFPTFVNTHRLLVRGVRIPTVAEQHDGSQSYLGADPGFPWWALTVGGGSAAVIAIAFIPPKRRPYTAEHRLVDLP